MIVRAARLAAPRSWCATPHLIAELLATCKRHAHGTHHRRRLPERIPNRFELTLAATYRARQITARRAADGRANRDKPTVIALREIAAGKVGIEMLNKTGRR